MPICVNYYPESVQMPLVQDWNSILMSIHPLMPRARCPAGGKGGIMMWGKNNTWQRNRKACFVGIHERISKTNWKVLIMYQHFIPSLPFSFPLSVHFISSLFKIDYRAFTLCLLLGLPW